MPVSLPRPIDSEYYICLGQMFNRQPIKIASTYGCQKHGMQNIHLFGWMLDAAGARVRGLDHTGEPLYLRGLVKL
jgi:hypothetical protein